MAIAAWLWFYMFSPWTGGISPFWLNMSLSAVILTVLALKGKSLLPFGEEFSSCRTWGGFLRQMLLGVALASVLWGIFWTGDKLSQSLFVFARPQVDRVYEMKDGFSAALIALLLLFVIGPAEEFFWRGYVQRAMGKWLGPTASMFVTAGIYALVHIWSFNFMLVMAALVAGGVWGLLYRLRPSWLPALLVSHALWDALVFVLLPI